MKTETIEKILNFLYEKEGYELPKAWIDLIKKLKLIQELENHPDGTQYKHRGSLDLRDSTIRKLPNDLYVTGYLDLRKSKLTKLPNDLYVDGYLNLRYCQYLTELPDNLHVEGSLHLDSSNIKKLPNDLYVWGNLELFSCQKLIELPENLYVGRDVYIYDALLAEKYTNEEIREIVTSKGGKIEGQIIR